MRREAEARKVWREVRRISAGEGDSVKVRRFWLGEGGGGTAQLVGPSSPF